MRYTVLVIDDQWSMQELARIILQAAGYHVLLAGDGSVGLSLARTQHPDILVLDMHMPGMSGIEVLRNLRHQAKTANIPVVLISTREGCTEIPAGLRVGVCCLQKPFTPQALLLVIDNMLNQDELPIAV